MRQSRRFAKRVGRDLTEGETAVPKLTIIVGNKAYSSWSLRGWLMLSATGGPFDEIVIPLDRPETRAALLAQSPAGRVPVLKADGLTIWDSLAIGEYLAERFPEAGAVAIGGRGARRGAVGLGGNAFRLRGAAPGHADGSETGAAGRGPHGRGPGRHRPHHRAVVRLPGPGSAPDGHFLFGGFGIADAMFAPVATRLDTYGVALDAATPRLCRSGPGSECHAPMDRRRQGRAVDPRSAVRGSYWLARSSRGIRPISR